MNWHKLNNNQTGGVFIEGAFAMAILIAGIFATLDLSSYLSNQQQISKALHNTNLKILISEEAHCFQSNIYNQAETDAYAFADEQTLNSLEISLEQDLRNSLQQLNLNANDFQYQISFYSNEEMSLGINQKYVLLGIKARERSKIFGVAGLTQCLTILNPINLHENSFPSSEATLDAECSIGNLIDWSNLSLSQAVLDSQSFCSGA